MSTIIHHGKLFYGLEKKNMAKKRETSVVIAGYRVLFTLTANATLQMSLIKCVLQFEENNLYFRIFLHRDI